MKLVLIVKGALIPLVLLACSDTTEPEQLICPDAQVLLCAQVGDYSAAVMAASHDAGSRSLGGLRNGSGAAGIRQPLSALNTALNQGNITAARRSLAETRAAVTDARAQLPAFPGDAPDLSAIELALLQIERAIQ